MKEIKRLPEVLVRHGIKYKLILRTERVALWELSIHSKCVGYEVGQIYIYPAQIKFGKLVPPKESLPPDSKFGVKDNSKCFFPFELDEAKKHFTNLNNILILFNTAA